MMPNFNGLFQPPPMDAGGGTPYGSIPTFNRTPGANPGLLQALQALIQKGGLNSAAPISPASPQPAQMAQIPTPPPRPYDLGSTPISGQANDIGGSVTPAGTHNSWMPGFGGPLLLRDSQDAATAPMLGNGGTTSLSQWLGNASQPRAPAVPGSGASDFLDRLHASGKYRGGYQWIAPSSLAGGLLGLFTGQ